MAAAQNSQSVQVAQEQLNRDTISLANAQNTLSVILDTNQQTVQKDQLSLANAQSTQDLSLNVSKAQVAQSEQALQTAKSTDAVTVSAAQFDQAQSNLKILNEQLQDGVLLSPVDGVVTAINTPVGQNAGNNGNIISVAALNPTQATVNIPESSIGKIKKGMEMKVNVPTLNKTFEGTVAAIRPTLDAVTKAYGVDIKIDDPKGEVLPGMFATSSMKSEGRQAIMVPADAILSQPNGTAAFVVKDGKAKKVTVKIGTMTSSEFEVTSGLSEGDELVVKGQELLSDKASVQIVQPGQEGQQKQGQQGQQGQQNGQRPQGQGQGQQGQSQGQQGQGQGQQNSQRAQGQQGQGQQGQQNGKAAQGDKPEQADKTAADKKQEEKKQGEKPQADKAQGEKPKEQGEQPKVTPQTNRPANSNGGAAGQTGAGGGQ